MTGLRNWPIFFRGQSGLSTSENKDITGEVCSIACCSPHFHALLPAFHIGFKDACFVVRCVVSFMIILHYLR